MLVEGRIRRVKKENERHGNNGREMKCKIGRKRMLLSADKRREEGEA